MSELDHGEHWLRQAALRIQWHWPIKAVGTTAGIAGFMCIYFLLLRHPLFPVTVMPLTGLDRFVGFEPWAIVPYASLWLYVSLVPTLLCTRRELLPYVSAVTILSLVGFAIFLFWPTVVPRPDIDWARYPSVEFLKSADASGNACPSLHVAFAVLSGLWLARVLRKIRAPAWVGVLNAGWCGLIVYSTLATKQHVALDMAAGAALGWAVDVLHFHVFPRLDVRYDAAGVSRALDK